MLSIFRISVLVYLCIFLNSSALRVIKSNVILNRLSQKTNFKKDFRIKHLGSRNTKDHDMFQDKNQFIEKSNDLIQPSKSINKDRSLLKVNILMLLFYASLGSSMPYIPLYYKSLGLSESKIGLLGAITPAITFVVSPLWGAFADSTGYHKSILILTFITSVISRACLAIGSKNSIWLGFIVALTASLFAPVKPLIDSAVMSLLSDKSEYGKSRLFGQVGFGIGSFLVGPLLAQQIKYIFIVQLLISIPTVFLMLNGFNPKSDVKKSESIEFKNALRHSRKDLQYLAFFLVVFVIGVNSGIIENFAYVKISEVSGPNKNVLGISRLISSLAGGPMFWLSGYINKKIGINGILSLSFVFYILRFLIYASIKNPWQAIPAEILRGITFGMFWSGATYFIYNSSPTGLKATMLGLLNGMYGGLGQSLGALIGGALCRNEGISKAFYLCATFDAVIFLLFILSKKFYSNESDIR